jgi:eukaryotic-like serine/threonine-protein kinase
MTQPGTHNQGYPQAGDILEGKYVVDKLLGEGGMGAVALATHQLRKARVALKFMNPMFLAVPGAVERFHNEGVAASQVQSDHCVQIFDVGTLPSGAPYLVMEYLQGVDLSDLIHRDGRPGLPVERAVHFVLQILRGLQAAHAKGIIHRDMKPSNCFVVTKDGEDDFVKLLDFGISKVRQPGDQPALTQTNSALGTPLYMSPEQAKSPRDVDYRSDIYSVGVILYELLTGRTPFFSESGEFTEILFKLFTTEPPHISTARPDLPPGLANAVHKALARDRDQRFTDVVEFADALAPFAAEHSRHLVQRMRGLPPGSRVIPNQGHPGGAGTAGGSQKISLRPPPQSNYPPGASDTSASGAEVLAATMGVGTTGDVMIPKAPLVPGGRTDLGATRDASQGGFAPKKRSGPSALLVLVPIVMLGIGATAGVAVLGARKAKPPVPVATVSAEPPPKVNDVPPVDSTPPVLTVPIPSVPTASASPSASAAPPKPPPPQNPQVPNVRRNPDGKPCGPGLNPCWSQ